MTGPETEAWRRVLEIAGRIHQRTFAERHGMIRDAEELLVALDDVAFRPDRPLLCIFGFEIRVRRRRRRP